MRPRKASFPAVKGIGFILSLLALTAAGCGPDVIEDYGDLKVSLTTQDGAVIEFPGDLAGKPVVLGFVYTHCPDICSLIAANVLNIEKQYGDGAHYVLITFDPERDDPETLKTYAAAFGMDREPFLFLTGDPGDIDSLMQRLRVRTETSYESMTDAGVPVYFLNHSDKLMLLDDASRLVMEYGGSMTPPSLVLEDMRRLF